MRPLNQFTYVTIWLLIFFLTKSAFAQMPVFVSIVPQKYFVQQIGKDLVDIHVMVQPGAAPHTYEPKPRQMVAIAKTTLYFAIGVEFERIWLNKISAANSRMRVVHTDQGIEKLPMTVDSNPGKKSGNTDALEHHGKEEPGKNPENGHDHHTHSGLDPHIWLSPPLVKIQARTILAALTAVDPAHAKVYQTNFQQFISKLDQLDNRLTNMFAGQKGFQFVVFHPAWGYFAQAYGLRQVPIELEGKTPKPAQLQHLIKHARAKGIRVIFAQPQLSTKNARLVARAIDGQVVLADPLAENWTANLETIAEKISAVLK